MANLGRQLSSDIERLTEYADALRSFMTSASGTEVLVETTNIGTLQDAVDEIESTAAQGLGYLRLYLTVPINSTKPSVPSDIQRNPETGEITGADPWGPITDTLASQVNNGTHYLWFIEFIISSNGMLGTHTSPMRQSGLMGQRGEIGEGGDIEITVYMSVPIGDPVPTAPRATYRRDTRVFSNLNGWSSNPGDFQSDVNAGTHSIFVSKVSIDDLSNLVGRWSDPVQWTGFAGRDGQDSMGGGGGGSITDTRVNRLDAEITSGGDLEMTLGFTASGIDDIVETVDLRSEIDARIPIVGNTLYRQTSEEITTDDLSDDFVSRVNESATVSQLNVQVTRIDNAIAVNTTQNTDITALETQSLTTLEVQSVTVDGQNISIILNGLNIAGENRSTVTIEFTVPGSSTDIYTNAVSATLSNTGLLTITLGRTEGQSDIVAEVNIQSFIDDRVGILAPTTAELQAQIVRIDTNASSIATQGGEISTLQSQTITDLEVGSVSTSGQDITIVVNGLNGSGTNVSTLTIMFTVPGSSDGGADIYISGASANINGNGLLTTTFTRSEGQSNIVASVNIQAFIDGRVRTIGDGVYRLQATLIERNQFSSAVRTELTGLRDDLDVNTGTLGSHNTRLDSIETTIVPATLWQTLLPVVVVDKEHLSTAVQEEITASTDTLDAFSAHSYAIPLTPAQRATKTLTTSGSNATSQVLATITIPSEWIDRLNDANINVVLHMRFVAQTQQAGTYTARLRAVVDGSVRATAGEAATFTQSPMIFAEDSTALNELSLSTGDTITFRLELQGTGTAGSINYSQFSFSLTSQPHIGSLPTGATSGQILGYNGSDVVWRDETAELPPSATSGQILGYDGANWIARASREVPPIAPTEDQGKVLTVGTDDMAAWLGATAENQNTITRSITFYTTTYESLEYAALNASSLSASQPSTGAGSRLGFVAVVGENVSLLSITLAVGTSARVYVNLQEDITLSVRKADLDNSTFTEVMSITFSSGQSNYNRVFQPGEVPFDNEDIVTVHITAPTSSSANSQLRGVLGLELQKRIDIDITTGLVGDTGPGVYEAFTRSASIPTMAPPPTSISEEGVVTLPVNYMPTHPSGTDTLYRITGSGSPGGMITWNVPTRVEGEAGQAGEDAYSTQVFVARFASVPPTPAGGIGPAAGSLVATPANWDTTSGDNPLYLTIVTWKPGEAYTFTVPVRLTSASSSTGSERSSSLFLFRRGSPPGTPAGGQLSSFTIPSFWMVSPTLATGTTQLHYVILVVDEDAGTYSWTTPEPWVSASDIPMPTVQRVELGEVDILQIYVGGQVDNLVYSTDVLVVDDPKFSRVKAGFSALLSELSVTLGTDSPGGANQPEFGIMIAIKQDNLDGTTSTQVIRLITFTQQELHNAGSTRYNLEHLIRSDTIAATTIRLCISYTFQIFPRAAVAPFEFRVNIDDQEAFISELDTRLIRIVSDLPPAGYTGETVLLVNDAGTQADVYRHNGSSWVNVLPRPTLLSVGYDEPTGFQHIDFTRDGSIVWAAVPNRIPQAVIVNSPSDWINLTIADGIYGIVGPALNTSFLTSVAHHAGSTSTIGIGALLKKEGTTTATELRTQTNNLPNYYHPGQKVWIPELNIYYIYLNHVDLFQPEGYGILLQQSGQTIGADNSQDTQTQTLTDKITIPTHLTHLTNGNLSFKLNLSLTFASSWNTSTVIRLTIGNETKTYNGPYSASTTRTIEDEFVNPLFDLTTGGSASISTNGTIDVNIVAERQKASGSQGQSFTLRVVSATAQPDGRGAGKNRFVTLYTGDSSSVYSDSFHITVVTLPDGYQIEHFRNIIIHFSHTNVFFDNRRTILSENAQILKRYTNTTLDLTSSSTLTSGTSIEILSYTISFYAGSTTNLGIPIYLTTHQTKPDLYIGSRQNDGLYYVALVEGEY